MIHPSASDTPIVLTRVAPARFIALRFVEDTPLTESERSAILGETAARIFHIDRACASEPSGIED